MVHLQPATQGFSLSLIFRPINVRGRHELVGFVAGEVSRTAGVIGEGVEDDPGDGADDASLDEESCGDGRGSMDMAVPGEICSSKPASGDREQWLNHSSVYGSTVIPWGEMSGFGRRGELSSCPATAYSVEF